MFVLENINPKNKKTTDCVIRAISKAEGKSWLEIYDSLSALARKEYSIPNDNKVYGKYLDKYPKLDVKYQDDGRTKRYTVADVCKFGKGIYIVAVAKHLTVIIDGVLYDTWDCRTKSAYKIWKVK